jgi:transcriptional regulator with XRE-family HTH domain
LDDLEHTVQSPAGKEVPMADTTIERLAAARARNLRRSIGDQLLELREDRELSQREVAAAVGLDRSWLARAETGEANLTLDGLAALATALGAEPSLRLYPAAGTRLQDHLQTRLLEALLAPLHPRWRPRLEVAVYRPVRGVIDVVLTEPRTGEAVGGEAHSEIRSAERQLRWAGEKVDSLPSATGWPWMGREPAVGRLLLLRSTAATRAVVAGAPALFGAAYPGRTADAVAALTEASGTFPGAAIIWVDVRGSASRLLHGPPRGIEVGR